MMPKQCTTEMVLLALMFLPQPRRINAQAAVPEDNRETLPSAPNPQQIEPVFRSLAAERQLSVSLSFPSQIQPQASDNQADSSSPNTSGVMHLTRSQAEQLAIKNNPRISVSHLLALAQHQVYRETRAAELPTFNGLITAAEAHEGSRIGAGDVTASRLFVHAGAGIVLNQLITDFGRTINLVSSAKLRQKAQNANALATTEDIVLTVDQAFYNTLQAEAVLKVALQTVATRQSVTDQVNELTKNELRSSLDLAFAQVNLSQAKLLQLDAQNNAEATLNTLTAVLGFDTQKRYDLVVENKEAAAPPRDIDALIALALRQRPDLQALTYNQAAAEKFRRAQRDLLLPSVNALGLVGGTPVRPDCIDGCNPNYFISSWYGAIGVNVNIPIFNGFLYSAQAAEATANGKAAAENTRDLRDQVVRDVRNAWLAANTAFQRLAVTAELAKEADLSLDLARGRYDAGLGSIVELSQAQLQQADAAIEYVNAQYQYRLTLATLNFEIGAQP
jgi:outer membrane protein